MTGNDRSRAVAKVKLRLVALEAGAPPYDRPLGPPPMLARKAEATAEVKRSASAVAMRKSVSLAASHAEKLVSLPAAAVAAAYPDADSWAEASKQVADAIVSMQMFQAELRRRVPK
jgi:hypothetical protein